MKKEIDYRKVTEGSIEAYLLFRDKFPESNIPVIMFTAGYNAAMEIYKKK